MKFYDKNRQEIKPGQFLLCTDDLRTTEHLSIATVYKKGNQLCFAHLDMPEKLWVIEDCVNEEGVLEDYIIMEKKI